MLYLIFLGIFYELIGNYLAETIEEFLKAEDKEKWAASNAKAFVRLMLWNIFTGIPYMILLGWGIISGHCEGWILFLLSIPTSWEKAARKLYNKRWLVTLMHSVSMLVLFFWARRLILSG